MNTDETSTTDETVVYNPEYTLSLKGKCLLSHNGYSFTMCNRYNSNGYAVSKWRCTYKGTKTRKGCKAKANCYEKDGVVRAVIKGVHTHLNKNEP